MASIVESYIVEDINMQQLILKILNQQIKKQRD